MWSFIGLLCFLGIFLFFGTAIYAFFIKDEASKFIRKTSFILSGICLIIFWFSPFRNPGLEIFFNVELEEVEKDVKPEIKEETINVTSTNEDRQITANGGLGDTLSVLENKYGEYESDYGRITFNKGYIYTTEPFNPTDNNINTESIIWNITVSFEATDYPNRTKEETFEISQTLIPEDAIKIREREVILNGDYTTDIVEYKSDLLATRIYSKNLYGDAELGTFAVHLNKYTGSEFEQGYFQIGIKLV